MASYKDPQNLKVLGDEGEHCGLFPVPDPCSGLFGLFGHFLTLLFAMNILSMLNIAIPVWSFLWLKRRCLNFDSVPFLRFVYPLGQECYLLKIRFRISLMYAMYILSVLKITTPELFFLLLIQPYLNLVPFLLFMYPLGQECCLLKIRFRISLLNVCYVNSVCVENYNSRIVFPFVQTALFEFGFGVNFLYEKLSESL